MDRNISELSVRNTREKNKRLVANDKWFFNKNSCRSIVDINCCEYNGRKGVRSVYVKEEERIPDGVV
ncbi:MAG: hypothetical protein JXC33_03050 [Deltaproteobacteria bacterium]|nr:hypothetical protein [Deltaproteobacteria bacterium]